jgi:EAL domain-containing protein (putative c-di-GMP-specific phosphodiesterase class I)
MACQCRSGRRDFVVIAPDETRRNELTLLAEDFDWETDPAIEAVRIELGADCRFGDPGEVVNFLRDSLSAKTEGVRAQIIPEGDPLDDHYGELIHADPLDEYGSASTALLELLEDRRIESWYQPIYAGPDLEPRGFECLMRGRDTDGDIVYPDELLEQAFEQKLQFMLDRVCREQHLRNAAEALPDDAQILINFLPTSIYKPEYCLRTTRAVVDELGLDQDRITFEVVETEEIEDREHLVGLLEHYRDHGYGVALDDVGSGYAGLGMLADLQPDVVKIDREIIWNLEDSAEHRQICESLVSMTDADHQRILAEGVETPEQFDYLTSIGVDLFQGYLFRKPAPAPETEPEWQP